MPTKERAADSGGTTVTLSPGMSLMLNAEEVLRRCEKLDDYPRNGYRVTGLGPEDAATLRMVGLKADEPPQVRKLFGRIRAERELGAAAGSTEQFAAAEKAAVDTAKAARTKGEKLRQQIAEAQQELATLEEAAREAAGRRDKMATARQRLTETERLPLFVRSRVEQLETAITLATSDAERERFESIKQQAVAEYVKAVTDGGPDWFDRLIVSEEAV